jgi:transcriptional regulator with XRE-family HTH domain
MTTRKRAVHSRVNPASLRTARLQSDLTQADLAKRLGLKRGVISNWEAGWDSPGSDSFDKLVEIFGPGIGAGHSTVDTGTAPSALGQWLRKSREAKGWTLAELGKRASLSGPAIYKIESGKTRTPSKGTIRQLERALGKKLDPDSAREFTEESSIEGLGEFETFDPYDQSLWPSSPGVYVLYDIAERPLYVGQSNSIKDRLRDHEQKFWFKRPIVDSASYVSIQDNRLRVQVEKLLIKFLKSNAVLNEQNVARD